jgi:hypothetical protein
MYDAVTSGGSGGSGTGYQNSSGSSGSGRSQGNYLSYQDYPQPPPTQKDLQRASSTTAHLPTTTTTTSTMMNPNTRESYQIPTYRDQNNNQNNQNQPIVPRTNLGGGGEVSNNNRRFYQTNNNQHLQNQQQQRTFHNPKLSQQPNIIYEGYDNISPSIIPSPSPSMSSTGFLRGNGGGRSPPPSSCGAVADINPMCIPCLAIYSHLKDCPLCIQLLQNSSFVQEKNKEMNRMRNIEYAILVIVSIILLWNLVPFLSSLFTMMKQRRSSIPSVSSSSSDQGNTHPDIKGNSSAFSYRTPLLLPHGTHHKSGPHQ